MRNTGLRRGAELVACYRRHDRYVQIHPWKTLIIWTCYAPLALIMLLIRGLLACFAWMYESFADWSDTVADRVSNWQESKREQYIRVWAQQGKRVHSDFDD